MNDVGALNTEPSCNVRLSLHCVGSEKVGTQRLLEKMLKIRCGVESFIRHELTWCQLATL